MAQHAVRRKYEACIKLKVVAFAKLSSSCAAAWNLMLQKIGGKIKSMSKNECINKRGTSQWPNLQKNMAYTVTENHQNGKFVTRNSMCFCMSGLNQTKVQAKDSRYLHYGTHFMEKNDLVLRQKTTTAQK
jgi:hypothetical protein